MRTCGSAPVLATETACQARATAALAKPAAGPCWQMQASWIAWAWAFENVQTERSRATRPEQALRQAQAEGL